jgi:hypothetical protein
MKPEKNTNQYMKSVRLKASGDLDARVHGDIDHAWAEAHQTIKVPTERNPRRTLMKSPMLKLALAAGVVIAALVVIVPMLSSKPAFAEVIKPLLNARTVAFDFVLGEDSGSPVIHDIVAGNRVRRTMSNLPLTMIMDLDSGKMMTLEPTQKTALYVDIQGQVTQGTERAS